MTSRSRGPTRAAFTLVEVMVAGAVMSLILTMVGQALVMGLESQQRSTEKVQAVRQATIALELLARDYSMVYQSGVVNLLATPTRPGVANELRITNYRTATNPEVPERVTKGYWYVPSDKTVRRLVYQDGTTTPMPDQPPDGKIIARDVREFLVSSQTVGSLTVLRAEMYVAEIAEPIIIEAGPNQW